MAIAHQSMDLQDDGTRCARCGQSWPGAAPAMLIGMGTVGERRIEGCDSCGTDEHLIDVAPGAA